MSNDFTPTEFTLRDRLKDAANFIDGFPEDLTGFLLVTPLGIEMRISFGDHHSIKRMKMSDIILSATNPLLVEIAGIAKAISAEQNKNKTNKSHMRL